MIALAISVGGVVVGAAVCTPGICGCASWIGISDSGQWGDWFLFLFIGGMIGIAISVCWLVVLVGWRAIRRRSERQRG